MHTTRLDLLELVRRGRARTRRDLSLLTGLSRSAVAQTVAELVAEGVLAESATVHEERPGRPSTQLRLMPRCGWVGAIDLGHQYIAVAVGDMNGCTTDEQRGSWPVDGSASEALELAGTMLARLLAGHQVRRGSLRAIGVSLPFPVVGPAAYPVGDTEEWKEWNGVRPTELLGLPASTRVVVDNDANLGAWGEFVDIATPDLSGLLYVIAGDGLGGGLIAGGRIFRGSHGTAGEMGHAPVPGCALRCRCGHVGCLDPLVAAANLHGTDALIDQAGRALGAVLAQVSSFIDPDVVTLGGDLAGNPAFIGTVRDEFGRHDALHRARFTTARLAPLSALCGALDRAKQAAWSGVAQPV